MRALRFHAYGSADGLAVEDVPEPQPRAGEAKVRVHAVALNPLDWKLRAGHLRYLPMLASPPRGIGCDLAGKIVAVGGGATARHVGEAVFGAVLPFMRDGALADLVCVPFDQLAPLPGGLDAVHAATLPTAAGAALQGLVDIAHVQPGQSVLVTGAAGGVGHFAVQLATALGARVTGVCGPANVAFVQGQGATRVIDYTREDFTRESAHYDAVLDAAAATSFRGVRRQLTDRGVYVSLAGDARAVVGTAWSALGARLSRGPRAALVLVRHNGRLLERLRVLAEAGSLRPHVERVIGLADVAEAQRAMEQGHGRGKIVVRMS